MNVTFTFEKILAAFVDPKIRGVASKGGTRSGKTWATLQMLHLLALNNPQPLVISCVAATFPMVKRGMLRDFKAMVAAEGYWDENKFRKKCVHLGACLQRSVNQIVTVTTCFTV